MSEPAILTPPRPGALDGAVESARDHLLRLQHPDGYWVGELEADVSVAAGYIPLMHFMLGRVDPERARKVIAFVRERQRPDGSWSSYHGGPGDLNVTIQTYFALKLAGVPASAPFMSRACAFVRERGGIGRANVLTRIWLAVFGQYEWAGTPSVPPEIILLPNWFFFNIYELASWSRATIVALTVVLSQRPVCVVPEHARLDELYLEPPGERVYPLENGESSTWGRFFMLLDSVFRTWERMPVKPGREAALKRSAEWMVEHQEADGSWGGIMLPWVYSLIALKSLGYPMTHPVIARGMKGLEGFLLEDDHTVRLQPATSPVWDTAWAVLSLREAGLPAEHPAICRAARWLLEEQITVEGDWKIKNPNTEAGCWAFEFDNDLYPDVDDTAVVARALRRVRLPGAEGRAADRAVEAALEWVVSMQSRDGGWAAFDRDNDRHALAHVPFADFMAPLDPTCADVTAHAVELLAEIGSHPHALQRGVRFLCHSQEEDGSWYGRWGVNYLYGTGLTLPALELAGLTSRRAELRRAVAWLEAHQNPDGGWGESCRSYEDPEWRGRGKSTASQTAWALLGLLAGGRAFTPAVDAGVNALLASQDDDGGWREDAYTGTGFPRAFYLRYDMYRLYFPLLTLARYRNLLAAG